MKITAKVQSEVKVDDDGIQEFLKYDRELNRVLHAEARAIADEIESATAGLDEPWKVEVWKADRQHRGRWIVGVNRGNKDEDTDYRFREAEEGYFRKAFNSRRSARRRRKKS